MLKAYIIDDDMPSLKVIERFLSEYGDIAVAGRFTNPLDALKSLAEDRPHVIFLDIKMAPMCGLEAARKILSILPEAQIIFTTAYDSFAVDAFELEAVDYLVKPIMKDRFDKAMERVLKRLPAPEADKRLRITCFGKFNICWQGKEPVRWRTEKSKELAALLISSCGREVSRDEIIELLWPDTDPDRAVRYLHNSIYYLRKSLESYAVDRSLIKIHGNYTMLIDGSVENDLSRLYALLDTPEKDVQALELICSILKMDFMEGEDWEWASSRRQYFAEKYIETAIKLAKTYIAAKDLPRAEDVLRQAYQKNPYDERVTTILVKLYVATGQKVKAAKHFGEYAALIKSELGITPGRHLKELVASALND